MLIPTKLNHNSVEIISVEIISKFSSYAVIRIQYRVTQKNKKIIYEYIFDSKDFLKFLLPRKIIF